jgi:phage shock protein C
MSGKIYRLEQDKIIAGVCAGLADYFEIDPTLVRIVWLLSIFTCFGIIAYLVCWLIIPVKKTKLPLSRRKKYCR